MSEMEDTPMEQDSNAEKGVAAKGNQHLDNGSSATKQSMLLSQRAESNMSTSSSLSAPPSSTTTSSPASATPVAGSSSGEGTTKAAISIDAYHQLRQDRAKQQASIPSTTRVTFAPIPTVVPAASNSFSGSEPSSQPTSSTNSDGSQRVVMDDENYRKYQAYLQQQQSQKHIQQQRGNKGLDGVDLDPSAQSLTSPTHHATGTLRAPSSLNQSHHSQPQQQQQQQQQQQASQHRGPKSIHAIELIRIAGEVLQFPPTTVGTALVYYHKYRAYLYQVNKRERDNEATKADEYLFATACLHLASKCTEVSRKVRDLVNVTYRVMNPNQPLLALSPKSMQAPNVVPGEASGMNGNVKMDMATGAPADPASGPSSVHGPSTFHPKAPPPTATTYWHIRDSLLTTELMLLRILRFDLDVLLPFGDVVRIYKGMGMVFSPADEEAVVMYQQASGFDVFTPSILSSPARAGNDTGNAANSSPSGTGHSHMPSSTIHAAHPGIHKTLAALVQISITFCIDALCSSNIALSTSSRSLALGSIYLAVRSAGLELPMAFEEWCISWGRSAVTVGFPYQAGGYYPLHPRHHQHHNPHSYDNSGSGTPNNLSGGGSQSLFVNTSPVSAMDGLAGTPPLATMGSVGHFHGGSPSAGVGAATTAMSFQTASPLGPQYQHQPPLGSISIADDVRKVVGELCNFYTK